ncbi:MAG: hypothetical protein IJR84_05430 [Bacteroidaceae bacterium]|nr:hypothetical protein [Bacteroidaceae bacterium]
MKKWLDEIKASDQYYNAEGSGRNEYEAGQVALQLLMSTISASVIGTFDLKMEEVTQGRDITSETVMTSVVKTYTAGHLKDVKSLVLERKKEYVTVGRYISKETLDKIFAQRRERVIQYVCDGLKAEKDGNIDAALKCYNWALGLLNTVQNPSNVKYAADGGAEGEKILTNWIPNRIDNVLRNLKADFADQDGQYVKLHVTYNGDDVASVDIKYLRNNREVIVNVKKGIGEIQLEEGQDINDVDFEYEYAYKDEMRNDNELKMVSEIFNAPVSNKAHCIIYRGSKKEIKAANAQITAAAQAEATPHNNFLKRNLAKDYNGIVMKIAEAIKHKQYESVKEYFTPEGYKMYDGLLHYGQARILTIPELHCFPYRDKVICRCIPMKFVYPGNRREFTEDVTFTFNKDELIESVAFGLDRPTREQIYTDDHLEAWGEENCTMLATFLENYKTAWALHRLDYIRGIFADDARIITATVLKPVTLKNRTDDSSIGVMRLDSHPLVKYTEQNKHQYMKNLEDCFNRNEFINIRFTDCLIGKMYDERFGINIRQDYFSNTYSDTGFLFLMIDVTDPEWPLIQYRTWQPERDPSINAKNPDDPFWGVITGAQFQ